MPVLEFDGKTLPQSLPKVCCLVIAVLNGDNETEKALKFFFAAISQYFM